jgi:ribokinase
LDPSIRAVVCGAINWDVTLFTDHLPAPGEEVTITEASRVPGGTGGNVAVAAARLLGPDRVSFVGAVGDDNIGPAQRSLLEREGIQVEGLRTIPGMESGQAFITVDSNTGENVIASVLGANGSLEPAHIMDQQVAEPLAAAGVYAITDPPLDFVAALLSRARTMNALTYWDPGVALEADHSRAETLARDVDVLVLNESEARSLFGKTTDPTSLASKLRRSEWHNSIILKHGADGATLLDLETRRITTCPALPLEEFDLNVENTVGAGDAFLGALVAMTCRGIKLTDSVTWACTTAGLSVTKKATRDSPTWADLQEVHDFWRAHGIDIQTSRFA